MTQEDSAAKLASLTEIEGDVLRLTITDMRESEIAESLGISANAVRQHRAITRAKLNRGAAGCCALAGQAGWL